MTNPFVTIFYKRALNILHCKSKIIKCICSVSRIHIRHYIPYSMISALSIIKINVYIADLWQSSFFLVFYFELFGTLLYAEAVMFKFNSIAMHTIADHIIKPVISIYHSITYKSYSIAFKSTTM